MPPLNVMPPVDAAPALLITAALAVAGACAIATRLLAERLRKATAPAPDAALPPAELAHREAA
jgi:hypothetical protein